MSIDLGGRFELLEGGGDEDDATQTAADNGRGQRLQVLQ